MKKLCMLAIALISSSYGSDESKENEDATSAYASTGSIALNQHIQADRLPVLPPLPGSVEIDKILPLLMGFSETVGINSALLRSFKNQSHFDPMIIDVDILPFLTGLRSDEIYQALGSRDNDELLKTWLKDIGIVTADMHYFLYIISRLAYLPADRLEGVVTSSLQFITDDMDSYDRSCIISALGCIHTDKLVAVIASALQLTTDDDMEGFDRGEIISALGKVPTTDRLEVLVARSLELIADNANFHGRSEIVSELEKVPAYKLAGVVAGTLELMTDDMNCYHISYIITALENVPADRVEVIVASALKFTKGHMHSDDIRYLITELVRIPVDKFECVVASALQLITDRTDPNDIIKTISILSFASLQGLRKRHKS